jgi:purine-nucleoside phosphorylase
MEAAAFFAVSNHFNVPSAAVLRIADNLIENETVHSESFISNKAARTAQKVELNKFILKELVTD